MQKSIRRNRRYFKPVDNSLGAFLIRNPTSFKSKLACPKCGSPAYSIGKGIVRCVVDQKIYKELI